ncbi:unnamed protein product [Phytomonas sp. EM1]|nr:unnamed protein product [Phytomonas sp. EM1]|eukprot:CCW59675.1 unnamed protein product [Phytomonas sp. isolate EM1]
MDDSPSSDSLGAECWICRDADSTPKNPIISRVCQCIGSIGSVHQNCIDRWVFQNERMECPSCGVPYSIVYICPQVLAYPEGILSELKLVVMGFFVPILKKLIILILGFLLRFVMVPLVIGFVYYGEGVWMRRLSKMSWTKFLEVYTYGIINISLIHLTIFGFKHWTHHSCRYQHRLRQADLSIDHRLHAPGHAAEVDDNDPHPHRDRLEASDGDWEDYDSQDEDTDDEAFCDLSKTGFVASAHDWIDLVKGLFGIDERFFFSLAKDLGIACPLTLILRARQGLVIAFTIFVATWVLWQIWIPIRKIRNPRRRYEEVLERLEYLSSAEVTFLYVTYVFEMLLFSFILPIIAGVVVHYGTAPFLVKIPDSFSSFLEGLNIFKVVGYWIMGTLCSLILMKTMHNIIVPLFAHGVELFFVRSLDFRSLDTSTVRLNLMFARVFDVRLSHVVSDFLAVLIFEIGALLFFISVPCWVTFGIREALFGDLSSGRLTTPLSLGLPSRSDQLFRLKVHDVQQFLKTNSVLDSYSIPTYSELQSRTNTPAQTIVLDQLAKEISSDTQSISTTVTPLSLDDTKPLYSSTAFALTVAAMRNDIPIFNRLLLLEHQDWGTISTTWLLLRVFASSGYVCRACLLSVGLQLGLFEMSNLTSLSFPSTVSPFEGSTPGNADRTHTDLPQKKSNITHDFILYKDLLVDHSPTILQWKAPWMIPIYGTYADKQNKRVSNCPFGNCSTVHKSERLTPAAGLRPEAVQGLFGQVTNWDDNSIVCLVLVLITFLCRIPGFSSASRFILDLFLNHGSFVFFMQSVGLVSMTLIVFTCLLQFPIQKMQLRYLRPFVLFFGRHMGLEAFLFDADRLKLVDQFLRDSRLDYLDIPIVPPEEILMHREYALPNQKIPSYHRLRLFVFALLLLLVGTLLFWLPFIPIFSLMLCVPFPTVTMLLGAACVFFFLFDPSEFFECVFLAHGLIVVLLGFTLFSSYWALSKLSLRKLAIETFFYISKVKRHVSVYDLERESSGEEDRNRPKMLFIV